MLLSCVALVRVIAAHCSKRVVVLKPLVELRSRVSEPSIMRCAMKCRRSSRRTTSPAKIWKCVAYVNALGHHAGTVVVMDPMTGRVYSVVNQEWALRRGFKPCSTIKLVTGVAGLSENAIPPVDTVGDGFRTDLTSALAHSDNPFFQQVGSKIGFDKMVNYARHSDSARRPDSTFPSSFPAGCLNSNRFLVRDECSRTPTVSKSLRYS